MEYLNQPWRDESSILTAWLATHYSWQVALLIPGIIGIIIGLWLCVRLKELPQKKGFLLGVWRRDVFELRQEQASPLNLC